MWWKKATAHFRSRTESASVMETRGTSRGKTDGRRALTDKPYQTNSTAFERGEGEDVAVELRSCWRRSVSQSMGESVSTSFYIS